MAIYVCDCTNKGYGGAAFKYFQHLSIEDLRLGASSMTMCALCTEARPPVFCSIYCQHRVPVIHSCEHDKYIVARGTCERGTRGRIGHPTPTSTDLARGIRYGNFVVS